jgi:predicted PurR-regulated permease PerM
MSRSPFDCVATFSWRLLACLGALVTAFGLAMLLHFFAIPLVLGQLLCSATTPLVRRLNAGGMKPVSSAVIATIAVILLVTVLGLVLIKTVGGQWDDITKALTESLIEVAAWLRSIGLPEDVVAYSKQSLLASLESIAPVAVGGAVRVVSINVGVVLELLLALLFMFYFLIGGNDMWLWVLRQSGRPNMGRLDRTARRSWNALEGYMFAKLIVGLCDGTVIGLGLWLIGVPNALALGVLTVFAEFIPLLGPLTMGLVSVLIAYGHGGAGLGLLAFAIFLIVQGVNSHVTAPIVYGKTISLSPVVVLLAILMGGIIGGILGMLVAVPIAGVLNVVLTELRAPVILEPGC